MKNRFFIFFFVISACLTFSNCTEKVNSDAEKIKVKLVVDKFKQFWESKDMDLLSGIMAHDTDMVNYGTDANEIFIGWNALKDSIQKMLPAMEKTKIAVRNQIVSVGLSGNVAWFSEIWDWNLVFNGQPIQLPDQRLTGVLEKRNGNWVIVQFHNSVPVAQ